MTKPFEYTLRAFGYRLTDDTWEAAGRKTYMHDADVTHLYLTNLRQKLFNHGWQLRAREIFQHKKSGEIIEIEPGGHECTGHYLHLMKAAVIV